ncbi:MAG: histidine phosphatase family protein [Lautropia sp.]
MPSLYLVRHAQASFGAADYDRLSEIGHLQARRLGTYFATRGIGFAHAWCGTLRRQRETLAGVVDGLRADGQAPPSVQAHPGFDEYDPHPLLLAHAAHGGAPAGAATDAASLSDPAAARRAHFRLLRDALLCWARGDCARSGHRSFGEFQRDAHAAFEQAWRGLRDAATRAPHGDLLIVSSGGAIAAILARHLGMPDPGFVALNLEAYNTGVAEFRIGTNAVHLIGINAIAHLDTPQGRALVTHA